MNILLWVLQVVLALWNIVGPGYMMGHYKELANSWAVKAFPQPLWIVLGLIQILLALGLILPGIMKKSAKVTAISAVGIAVLSVVGTSLYYAYSGFPGMLWGWIPAILAAFVAYKRWPTKNK